MLSNGFCAHKAGFWFLCWITIFGPLFIYNAYIKKSKNKDEKHFDPKYAEELFLKGNIEALFIYCDKYYEQYPNDVWISWYRGIGNFNLGNPSEARLWFEKVVKINPNWKPEVTTYLDAMDASAASGPMH